MERSETHQFLARKNDGFRKGSTHPADCGRDPAVTLILRLPHTVAALIALRAIFFFQERHNDGDRLLRLFLHDPVA